MNWTQPICPGCYAKREPGRTPVRVSEDYADPENCCGCGQETRAGIYLRVDPRTVKFPAP
jgi:hypothetical protein